jgi:PAS domain S-box-containing protein
VDNSTPRARPDEATLLRLLADAARDFAIFAVEPDGTILTWNPGVKNITGYEEDEFIGRNCEMLFTPEDREHRAPDQEKGSALRDGRALDERYHLKKDGTRFWGSGFMHALYDDSGTHIGFAKILRDMTAQKRHDEEMEARVRERTRELEERTRELEASLIARAHAEAARQELLRRIVLAQEEERRRISRELHDSTGQHLAALGLELGLLDRAALTTKNAAVTAAHAATEGARLASEAAHAAELAARLAAAADTLPEAGRLARVSADAARTAAITSTDASAAAAAADAALTAINEAMPGAARLRALTDALSHDLHRLAVDLRPTSLDDLGLVSALRAYAETCAAARAGAAVTVESVGLEEDGGPARRLPSEVETALYRIVQEALTNAAKHAVPAGAKNVSVTLQRVDGHVLATIEDDGPGFDPETAGAGRLGLVGMRERAALLGGTLEVESAPGSGTTIYARLPVVMA